LSDGIVSPFINADTACNEQQYHAVLHPYKCCVYHSVKGTRACDGGNKCGDNVAVTPAFKTIVTFKHGFYELPHKYAYKRSADYSVRQHAVKQYIVSERRLIYLRSAGGKLIVKETVAEKASAENGGFFYLLNGKFPDDNTVFGGCRYFVKTWDKLRYEHYRYKHRCRHAEKYRKQTVFVV